MKPSQIPDEYKASLIFKVLPSVIIISFKHYTFTYLQIMKIERQTHLQWNTAFTRRNVQNQNFSCKDLVESGWIFEV